MQSFKTDGDTKADASRAPSRGMSWIAEIAMIGGLALLINTIAAQAFYVPTGSMEPTLLIGDELMVTKFPYGFSRYSVPLGLGPASATRLFGRLPDRGDVVVFKLPRDPGETYVKRVIGLPGDRVQMRGGRLWINEREVPVRPDGFGRVEDADGSTARAPRFIETLPGGREHPIFKFTARGPLDDTDVFRVTPGHIFVMGDNRDNSLDSRVSPVAGGVGLVPVENLVGRVEGVIGSWDLGIAHQPISTWPSGLRLSRFFSAVR
jgi:signal peptidase I